MEDLARGLESFTVSRCGAHVWNEIYKKSKLSTGHQNFQPSTQSSVEAILSTMSQHLGLPMKILIYELGKYWMSYRLTSAPTEGRQLLRKDFKSALLNLNTFYKNIRLELPCMETPGFMTRELDEGIFKISYFSQDRVAFSLLHGILVGFADFYGIKIHVEWKTTGGRLPLQNITVTVLDEI